MQRWKEEGLAVPEEGVSELIVGTGLERFIESDRGMSVEGGELLEGFAHAHVVNAHVLVELFFNIDPKAIGKVRTRVKCLGMEDEVRLLGQEVDGTRHDLYPCGSVLSQAY